jgi:hypothetical protein
VLLVHVAVLNVHHQSLSTVVLSIGHIKRPKAIVVG